MCHELDTCSINAQPQLAVLAVAETSLRLSILALHAAHHDLPVQAWNPDASAQTSLAAAIVTSAAALRHLLEQYQAATDHLIVETIPY